METEQVGEWVRQAQGGDRPAFGCLVESSRTSSPPSALAIWVTRSKPGMLLRTPSSPPLGPSKACGNLGRLSRGCSSWPGRPAAISAAVGRAGSGPSWRTRRRRPGTADAVVLVRAGLAALRPPDRMVLALAYLGGYSQSQIAEFLGVPVSTVKKRAFDARRRLRGVLPMVEASLEAQRPSRSPEFSNVILLYAAIRRADTAAVVQLVEADPSLVEAEEAWAVDEGRSASLVWPGRATPLIRAAEAGHLDIVDVLLGAGAGVDGQCQCETGESALWAAVANGRVGVAARLLEAGADPNCSSDSGTTALHIAVYRGRQDLVDLLQGAGADPDAATARAAVPPIGPLPQAPPS